MQGKLENTIWNYNVYLVRHVQHIHLVYMKIPYSHLLIPWYWFYLKIINITDEYNDKKLWTKLWKMLEKHTDLQIGVFLILVLF